ncbi:MAG: plastocyanin/azurin family copper-binding protein [Nitrososphaera sp.]
MGYSRYYLVAICLVSAVTFSLSFAEIPVIIPLGAANQNNPFSLSPSTLEVQVNDTVTWKNQDTAAHTVTTGKPGLGFDGRIDSGIIPPGGTFSYTFTKTGLYQYYCLFHPWMTGFVNVGTSTPDMPIGILVSTDKSVYSKGDAIHVSGQVSQFIANKQVTVWVTDSKGTGVSIVHTETRTGRDFGVDIPVTAATWIPGNNYTIYAQYGPASSVATALVQYEPSSNNNTVQDTTSDVTPSKDTYMSSYKKAIPDSNGYVTVQTGRHVYTSDSPVIVYGSIWDGVFAQVGGGAYLATVPISDTTGNTVAELVDVTMTDMNGNTVSSKQVQVSSDGSYVAQMKIPIDSDGLYHVQAQLKTKDGLVQTLGGDVISKLGSSTNFLVITPDAFPVSTNLGKYDVEISSNSTVTGFTADLAQKKISFNVQGESGTRGTTDVIVPKYVLGGQIQVLIDGIAQPFNSDGVIVTSDTASETGFEINYHHSVHTIELVGSDAAEPPVQVQAVPEFGLAPVILALSVAGIIAVSYRTKLV